MKLINKNLKKGQLKVRIENIDDLWYLNSIIDPGDIVKGKTLRKIKIGEKEQRKINIVKKPVFITLKAEKIEFHKYSNILRVLGIIIEGPDDIPKGSYHTFNLEENSIISIIKPGWLNYQLDKIKEACADVKPDIMVCVFDREEAYFALLKKQGYELLSKLKGNVQKKASEEKVKGSFYGLIIKTINDYIKRYKIEKIILASPAFWKEELLKEVKDSELKNMIVQAACSSADEKAINEVLKRPELRELLRQERAAEETKFVDELLGEISKNNLAAYGLKETSESVNAGSVKMFLITDSFIHKKRQGDNFSKIDLLMKTAEKLKGKVMIISSENDAGKKLDGLGGIGAILRYKLNY